MTSQDILIREILSTLINCILQCITVQAFIMYYISLSNFDFKHNINIVPFSALWLFFNLLLNGLQENALQVLNCCECASFKFERGKKLAVACITLFVVKFDENLISAL